MNNQQRAKALAERIKAQIEKSIGKGVNAARMFLVARVKEELSVPAPRKIVTDRVGNKYYRATTKAIKGHPPRKLSGKLRMSVFSKMVTPTIFVIGAKAKSDKGFNYPRYLDKKGFGAKSGQHPFMMPTYRKWKKELQIIIGGKAVGI
jgi:hypothetical protein